VRHVVSPPVAIAPASHDDNERVGGWTLCVRDELAEHHRVAGNDEVGVPGPTRAAASGFIARATPLDPSGVSKADGSAQPDDACPGVERRRRAATRQAAIVLEAADRQSTRSAPATA
jgi:hypothetical protein